jgi:hypothetical protein
LWKLPVLQAESSLLTLMAKCVEDCGVIVMACSLINFQSLLV